MAILGADVPAWTAILGTVAFIWAICRDLFSVLRGILRFAQTVRSINRHVTSGVRRWLGTPTVVTLTQAQYDALPVKDRNTFYAISD